MLGEEAAGNPSFVGRLRKGASPRLTTVDRVRAWMAANANAEETRATRARVLEEGPFGGIETPCSLDAPLPPAGCGAGFREEGGRQMNGNGTNYLNTREAAAWLNLSPRTLDRYPPRHRGRSVYGNNTLWVKPITRCIYTSCV